LPLLTTDNIKQSQQVIGVNKWYQKITFTLKLPVIKPASIIRQVSGL
jgi:hypothetical protein